MSAFKNIIVIAMTWLGLKMVDLDLINQKNIQK